MKFFKTRKELMDFEREIVNERFLEYYEGMCYNIHPGGKGGSVKRFTDEELRERHLKTARKQYRKNPEKRREQSRTWAENNYERYKEIQRESHRRQREKKKAAKLASQATPGS